MKKLFTIILFAVAGCSTSEDKPSDLTGDWKFQNAVISGTFKVNKSGDNYSVVSSKFLISGKTYNSTTVSPFTRNGSSLGNIELHTSDGFVVFSGNTFNDSFTEIKAITYVYAENCLTTLCPHNSISEDIIITR